MFLPIRDAPNPPGFPAINYALIAINVAVYLFVAVPLGLQPLDMGDPAHAEYLNWIRQEHGAVGVHSSAYDAFVFEHGYRPAAGSIATLFSSMFLHGGLMHLIGNMLFLWIYGDNVEARLGRPLYLVAYLASGAAATMFFAAFEAGSQTPMVGASGAISGVLGFYFVFFPRNVVHVAVLLFPFFMDVVQIRARFVLGFYLIVDNLLPVLAAHESGVAYGAHIGGFLAGFGAAHLLGGPGPDYVEVEGERRRAAPPPLVRGGATASTPAERVHALLRGGRHGEAAQVVFSTDEDELDLAPADALELGRWLADSGHPQAALSLFRRVLAQVPRGEAAAWAHLGAGYVQGQFLGRRTAAWQHFHDAIDCDPHGEAAQRARRALEQMGGAS